jgi:translocator protein
MNSGDSVARIQIMIHGSTNSTWRHDLGFGALAIIAVAAASVIGQLATYPNLAPWYAGLVKPSFNPPNWVFAPVWTTLYVLMAFAVWRILRLPQVSAARRLALSLFFIQLALNAAWSWMFFGANNPLLGLINVVPQFLAILATVVAFHRLDRMAAWCLVPLVAWVAFAGVLNVAIWRLNG